MDKENVTYDPQKIKDDFIQSFGAETNDIRVFCAPARINIIGEHIDYNGGMVFPAAINRYIYMAIRKRADNKIVYYDLKYKERFEFNLENDFVYNAEYSWANYLNGIISQLLARGYKLPTGFELLIVSNIPAGGGISSSSAFECCFARALCDTYCIKLDGIEIAKIGQMSEHHFMNVNCGIMDQFIISMARKNTAIKLNCADLNYEYVPLVLGDYSFVVMNSNQMRRLADSKYNERRGECEKALEILKDSGTEINELCDMSPEEWSRNKAKITDDVLLRRVSHCVEENQRVKDAVAALKDGDLAGLGKLMNASHASLKDNYEVTGAALDALAETAQKQEGCLGARMTGAGFGGCAIALVHNSCTDEFIKNVAAEYERQIGIKADFFVCQSGGGAGELKI